MKSIILASYLYKPNIGGVENSVFHLSKELSNNYNVVIISTTRNNISKEKPLKFEKDIYASIYRADKIRFIPEIFGEFINLYLLYKSQYKLLGDVTVISRCHISVFIARATGFTDVRYLAPEVARVEKRRLYLFEKNKIFFMKKYIAYHFHSILQYIAFRISSKVFVFSVNMKDQINNESPRSTCIICKPGVDSNRFNYSNDQEKNKLRYILNFEIDKIVIIAVGRFVAQKGYDRLIMLGKQLPDQFRIVLVGDGPEKKFYNDLIISNGINNVEIRSHSLNPEVYYKASDIFAMTSTYEPLGQTIIEAQSCGLPVVCYKYDKNKVITSTDEIIIDGNGYFSSINDKEGMVKSIIKASNDDSINKRVQVSKIATEKFSWSSLSNDLLL